MTPELVATIVFGILAYVVMGVIFLSKLNTCVEVLKNTIESHKENNDKQFERLEKIQNKHNNLIERMVVVEQSSKSAHNRIDDVRDELKAGQND